MKKFLISLIIVFIFSVVVFFIGLGTLRIKPDSFGVLVSKTGGVDEKPIKNGELSWYWELLLPTNSVIKSFTIEPYNTTKTISGELPSGDLYSSLYGKGDGFKYKFTFTISLAVTPENVVQLLKENKISSNDDFRTYLSAAADSIAQLAADVYLKNASKSSDFRPESVRRDELTKNFSLHEDFPLVDLTVFALTECKLPDFVLYDKLQKIEIYKSDVSKLNLSKSPQSDNKSDVGEIQSENKSNDIKNKNQLDVKSDKVVIPEIPAGEIL